MDNEQTNTQELLAILQTRPWTKAERALARQHIHLYYERKLAGLQSALFEAIRLNAPEKLTPFEVDEYTHRYHKQSQELYVYMNYRSSSNESLPGWLRAIDADDQGIAVWQPATRLPHEEEPQDQETTYREEKERVSCISSRCRTPSRVVCKTEAFQNPRDAQRDDTSQPPGLGADSRSFWFQSGSTVSDPLPERSRSIERAIEAASAKSTTRCASRGL